MSAIAAALGKRGERAGREAAARTTKRVAQAIGAAHPGLTVERDGNEIRVSGPGLARLVERDARLRVPEYWLDDAEWDR